LAGYGYNTGKCLEKRTKSIGKERKRHSEKKSYVKLNYFAKVQGAPEVLPTQQRLEDFCLLV
jgi:hypothetical protein